MTASHTLGPGTHWPTMFDRDRLAQILDLGANDVPQSLVCLVKAATDSVPDPSKPFADKTVFLE